MLIDIAPSICINLICGPWAADKESKEEIFTTSCKFALARVAISSILGSSYPTFAQKINELNFAIEVQRLFNLVHEIGHLFAAKVLTVREPEFKLTQTGGEVHYSTKELSSFGQRLGLLNCKKMILAAGPIFESISGAMALAIGCSLEKQYNLASYVKIAGLINLVKVVINTCEENEKSDSVKLERLGVSRQASFISFVILPLILAYGYTQGTPHLFEDA